MGVFITIDDVPASSLEDGKTASAAAIISHSCNLADRLSELSVPAIGFAGQRLSDVCAPLKHLDDSQFRAVLDHWIGRGHQLGNHTERHSRLDVVGVDRFIDDVVEGERVLNSVLAESDSIIRYFRSPYLQTGATPECKATLSEFLEARGYTYCPATVESGDWLFAEIYRHAVEREETTEQKKVIRDYLDFVRSMTDFAMTASDELLGRQVHQIGLFHANPLNVECFDRVIGIFRERGLEIISASVAMKDPAYALPDLHVGPGLLQIERWGLNFRGEIMKRPVYPQAVLDQWRRLHPPDVLG